MAINIPSKSSRASSQLRDGLRILAWKTWKNDHKDSELTGLDLYELFNQEWLAHDIQTFDLNAIKKFIKDLGYSEAEINKLRSEYYEARSHFSKQDNPQLETLSEEIPY